MNRRLAGCFAAILLACAAWIAAATVWMVMRDAVPVPILDQWAQLVGNRAVTLSWLVSQHNEHRLLFPRLVFLADRWLFAETGRLSLAASLTSQAGLALLLAWLGWRTQRARWRAAMDVAVVVALLAWSVQYENYTWPFQIQFFGVLLAASGCFAVVATMQATALGAACAIGLGVVAAFTLSNGIAVLVLAACLAAWLRRPRLYVAALAAAAVAALGLYLIGYQTPPEHTNPLLALTQPVALLGYAAAVLGGPFANAVGMLDGRLDPWLAVAAGGIGIALFIPIVMSFIRHRDGGTPCVAALATLCLFVLSTAVLTASGRMRFGLATALASRYATPALVFWAALWLLRGRMLSLPPPLAGEGRGEGGVARGTMDDSGARLSSVTAACLMVLIVATQPMFARVSDAVAADRAIAMPALVAGVADDALLAAIYPTPDVPLRERLTEFDTRTGAFSQPWAPWIGSKLHDHAAAAAPSHCAGQYDAATQIADPTYPGWRVTGSLQVPAFKQRRQIVALTDAGDRIIGFGISDAGSTTLTVAGPAGEPPRTGWVGAITGTEPGQAKAFVLLDRFHTACPLQNAPRLASTLQVAVAGPPVAWDGAAGSVDAVYLNQQVTIDGWAMVQTERGTPEIRVDTNLSVESATIASAARPDAAAAYHDVRLAKAGFRIVLMLRPGALPARPRLCLWSQDAVYGSHRLIMNPATEAQRQLCPP